MEKKYELTNETMTFLGHKLHRIKALRDVFGVKAGDLGGWIESESNLSQQGDCWVNYHAMVFGNAQVSDDAWADDYSIVFGNAKVYDSAYVRGRAIVCGNARICENATVTGRSRVLGNAYMWGYSHAVDNCRLYGEISTGDFVVVEEEASVSRDDIVTGYTHLDNVSGPYWS